MCTPLHRVHTLARAHSQRLIDNRNTTLYNVHGLFGIFGDGDPIVGKPGKRYFAKYGGTKVAFMHPCAMHQEALCNAKRECRMHPFSCDVVFVDGDKSFTGRYRSLVRLRAVSRLNAHVFMDEVTREDCINGTFDDDTHERNCRRLNENYWPSVRAYNRASREGWLQVQRCAWPATARYDGLCLATFVGEKRFD